MNLTKDQPEPPTAPRKPPPPPDTTNLSCSCSPGCFIVMLGLIVLLIVLL